MDSKVNYCPNFVYKTFIMNEESKAIQLYQDVYARWCNELSHDKNKLQAKAICLYICEQVLGDMGADRGYLFWTKVKEIIQEL